MPFRRTPEKGEATMNGLTQFWLRITGLASAWIVHTQEEFPGTGVGLATAKRIIERHGGTMWGIGEPGKGASFCFTINSPHSPLESTEG